MTHAILAALAAMLVLCGSAHAQVGITRLQSGPQSDASPITVVYPTSVAVTPLKLGPFEIEAAPRSPASGGNHRLVVISHGSGDSDLANFTLAGALVIAGFTVAIPEHRGDNWHDVTDTGPNSWKRRPAEVSRAIDAVSKDGRFANLLKVDRVGVYGMSAGGLTALSLAGAQWSVAGMMKHCADHFDDDAGFCLYRARSAEDVARLKQYYSGPLPASAEDLLSGPQDSRITAVAAAVPVGAIFTEQSLKAIRMPVGIVEAQADRMLNPALHSARILDLCGKCRRLDAIQGASHLDVLSPWPEAVAKATANVRGSERNPAVDEKRRGEAYARIAEFFRTNLLD